MEEIKKFFNNPNSNEESWEHIQRCVIRDILDGDGTAERAKAQNIPKDQYIERAEWGLPPATNDKGQRPYSASAL
jgi:hypothetical protein